MSFLDEARTGELWAKVKAALSGKQSKLTGTAGQVVGFGADGAAAAVQGWSNQNLLDNWYFAEPINQREQTEYNGKGYTIDRWYASELTEKAVVQSGSIQISGPGIQIFRQIMEYPATSGETLTLSVLTAGGVFASATAEMIGNGNHLHQVPIGSTSWFLDCWEVDGQLWPRIYKVNEADTSIDLVAVKLELGSKQTLAHQDASGNWVLNDPPPNKALELLKCQRYYQRIRGQILTGTVFDWDSEKLAYCPFRYPVRMRTTPNIALNGTVYARTGNAVTSSEALASIDGPSDESVMLWIKCADSAEAGMAATVYLDGDAYIEFNAEL